MSSMLRGLAERHPTVVEGERGRGLLRALVLRPGNESRTLLDRTRERGVLFTIAGERALRFTPPLIVTEAQLAEAVDVVSQALRA